MKLQTLLEHLLSEQLYEDIEEIANYPEGFDIKQFTNLSSMSAKTRYLKQHNLDKLGVGSARAVFVADPTTVIKVAKNTKGLEQNRLEVEISETILDDDDALIAKVRDHDDNYAYIEAERARKAKPSDFKAITGYHMKDIIDSVVSYVNTNIKGVKWGRKPDNYTEIMESPFASGLLELIVNFQMPTGDIGRISSWGVVSRDGKPHLVLVDYGLDEEIYRRFYAYKEAKL